VTLSGGDGSEIGKAGQQDSRMELDNWQRNSLNLIEATEMDSI